MKSSDAVTPTTGAAMSSLRQPSSSTATDQRRGAPGRAITTMRTAIWFERWRATSMLTEPLMQSGPPPGPGSARRRRVEDTIRLSSARTSPAGVIKRTVASLKRTEAVVPVLIRRLSRATDSTPQEFRMRHLLLCQLHKTSCLLSPLQGLDSFWDTLPRALPWAILFRAFSPSVCDRRISSVGIYRHRWFQVEALVSSVSISSLTKL